LKKVQFVLCGFGNVGKEFASLVIDRGGSLEKKYGIRLQCAAVIDIGGSAAASGGPLDLRALLRHVETGGAVETFPGYGSTGTGFADVEKINHAVLVECTPTNLETGEPGMTHVTTALKNGMHVVTACKAPVVLNLPKLKALAEQKSLSLKYSGATAAALPTIDVGETCLAGAGILKIEGVLNGTTNYILTRMSETGGTYDDALREAQELGIAETNPLLDVEGWDTACKMLILANSLMNAGLRLQDVAVTGITGVTPDDVRRSGENGGRLKLLGSCYAESEKMRVSVRPEILGGDHPLYHVGGTEKGIVFTTDTMGRVVVSGGKSSPVGAAAAMLKDIINIYRDH